MTKMAAIFIIATIILVYIVLSAYGARRCMEIPREPLEVTAGSTGLEYENVSFTSRTDNIVLKGWYFPVGGESAIILINGGFNHRIDENSDTLGLTRALVEKGYSILLFDLRGRGESEGKGLALSNIDEDIGGAVDFLGNRGYTPGRICLMGFCAGAVQACIYSSRNSIGVVVLDGCFLDVPTMVVREAATTGVPQFLTRAFVPGLLVMTRLIYGYKLVNPIDIIADVECPVLFVHEENDEFTTLEETNKLFGTSTNPANEVWEAMNTEHSRAFRNYPGEYIDKIDGFLRKNIGRPAD
jgi:alpha/beta superfamily hydrolase